MPVMSDVTLTRMDGMTCKGSLMLGSGCGRCARCRAELETLPEKIRQMRAEEARRIKPHDYEWGELWRFHHEKQWEHANREEYDEAADHKRRADAIREMLDAKKTAKGVIG